MSDVRVTTTRNNNGITDVTVVRWERNDTGHFVTELRVMVHPEGSVTSTVQTGDSNTLTHVPAEALAAISGAFIHADAVVSEKRGDAMLRALRLSQEGRVLADAADENRKAA